MWTAASEQRRKAVQCAVCVCVCNVHGVQRTALHHVLDCIMQLYVVTVYETNRIIHYIFTDSV